MYVGKAVELSQAEKERLKLAANEFQLRKAKEEIKHSSGDMGNLIDEWKEVDSMAHVFGDEVNRLDLLNQEEKKREASLRITMFLLTGKESDEDDED